MNTSQGACPLCQRDVGSETEDKVKIGKKGAEGINNASVERGDNIIVTAGTFVHKYCRMNYVNKKDIEKLKRAKFDCTSSVKRSARLSIGPFDSKTDCLYCGGKVVIRKINADYEDYSCVRTFIFGDKVLAKCKTRNDEWALNVKGRIEYFSGDLHAADSLYHHSCDVNFRTGRDVPMHHRTGSSSKRRKVGRPKDTDQEQAFLRMCYYFEENDEEQLTVTDLTSKMKEYLQDTGSAPYGNQYLKSRLLEYYGDSVFVAEVAGLHDIVTFRGKTSQILRDYFNMPNKDDEEAHKTAIIEAAAKFIKSDIKSLITPLKDEYPKVTDIKLESALRYIPPSLHCLLQNLFVGKDKHHKEASIGQAIVQAVRPRAVIAPLQLGLAVQMHHHFRSRFLIDILSAMGYCSSYSEVQRFEENAASSVAPDVLGSVNIANKMLLFAADNVDHNIVSLDGNGTFHGMGMIAAVTPGQQVTHTILRQKISELNIVDQTKVDIMEYHFAKHTRRSIEFQPLPVLNNLGHNIDILWEVSFHFSQPVPNWQGMMHILHKQFDHPGQSSISFLPMIDMYPGDKSCIFSTLEYICKLASQYNAPPVVTFDQPLFWKASEIIHEVPDNSPIRDVVLLLGSFHTFMNLLGAIGTLMDGSGLKDILETIYGENAVVHMMSGKAVQRSFRGHLLVSKCLTQQLAAKVIEGDPGFENLMQELERLYTLMEAGEIDLDTLLKSNSNERIIKALTSKKCELSNSSMTSKLWLNYQQMLGVARQLIKADRTGSWRMHLHAISECLPIFAAAGHANYLKSAYLYIQKMEMLENENPVVFQKFLDGFHVIRRTNQYWAGLGSDLVIEQTLMRSLKSTGGLTRGSGMTEHQRAIWTMSAPISSTYNYAMQDFNNTVYTTSEQHKEATASRMERDRADFAKLATKLEQHPPFPKETTLRNIVTGINADKDVNVQDLFVVGRDTVKHMEGQSVFSYSYKRKTKVKTLAAARAIKVNEDRTIDPALLFQRFLVVSQSGELCLDEVMKYELSPYPPALFEAKYLLQKADKAQLLDAIRKHVTSSDAAVLQSIPKTDEYVLDGGSLLHRLKWKEGSTYSSIADTYASFAYNLYGKATVVFDGYSGGPSTKDNAHQRRKTQITNTVNISDATKFVGKKDHFLANDMNKQALIHLIGDHLRQKGCHVIHAEGDADVDIVKAAITMSSYKSTTLIGEDTDLLVLLLYLGAKDCKDLYFRSDKHKEKPNVYNIKVLKQLLGDDVCSDMLFAHAFSGCDTTSRIFGVGKKSVFQKVVNGNFVLHACSKIFCAPKADQVTIESIGCKAMVSLFNGTQSENLESLRYGFLCKKVATAKTFVKPERLPPTTSATNFHSRRTYLQVMQWMGKNEGMDPTVWGWDVQGDKLVPLMMDNSPAPDTLLKIIRCSCSTGCSTLRCTCKKHGLECTTACGHCQNGKCDNMAQDSILDDDEIED